MATLWETSSTTDLDTLSVDALNSATTSVDVSAATAPTIWQVLTATSSTAATWQDAWWGWGWVSEAFSAYFATSESVPWSVTKLNFDWEIFDSGWNFNTSTWQYTAPSDWTYRFDVWAEIVGSSDQWLNALYFYESFNQRKQMQTRASWANVFFWWTLIIELSTNDTIEVRWSWSWSYRTWINADYFSWYKLF